MTKFKVLDKSSCIDDIHWPFPPLGGPVPINASSLKKLELQEKKTKKENFTLMLGQLEDAKF